MSLEEHAAAIAAAKAKGLCPILTATIVGSFFFAAGLIHMLLARYSRPT